MSPNVLGYTKFFGQREKIWRVCEPGIFRLSPFKWTEWNEMKRECSGVRGEAEQVEN